MLWSDKLPSGGCWDRWRHQQEQGAITELSLYKVQARANCQVLDDSKEGNCLVMVNAVINYIDSQMGGGG